MANSSDPSPVLRLTFLSVVVIGLFLALLARLWFLQVLAGDRYVEIADNNRIDSVVLEAPRGSILTDDGEELVRNRPALTISADRQLLLDDEGEPRDERAERVIGRLGALLDLDRDEVLERMTNQRRSPFRPVPIEFDVEPETVFAVREHQELFTGVVAETLPVREYPHGELASHIVGYLNEISDAELSSGEFTDYRAGDQVGRAGLEQAYESDLRGRAGVRYLVVNAQRHVVDVQSERAPVQGNDLVVSLDLELQEAVERLLEDGMVESRSIERDDGRTLPSTAGSAIVLDADDGRVLAMASFPDYDPREFVGGLSTDYAEYLYQDPEVPSPTVNRAIQGRYPPGSVFKPASGAAYVEAGLVSPRGQVGCPAAYEVGGITFRNWNRGVDEGAMDLSEALMRSCDTYFYELAHRQWQREQRQVADSDGDLDHVDEVLSRIAKGFGYGRQLGVDLPSEASGTIPDRATKQAVWLERREQWCAQAEATEDDYQRAILDDNCLYGGAWRGGDAVNTSIGQGEILSTPLQVAASYVAIANGGTLYRPYIGQRVVDPSGEVVREVEPETLGELPIDDETLQVIQEGLDDVVMHRRGTARSAFDGFPLDDVPVAGKTGTAEFGSRVPYAWFAGYAPADEPEIVVVVNIEEGGGGSQTAAPIVRNIMEHWFGITRAEDAEFEAGEEILD